MSQKQKKQGKDPTPGTKPYASNRKTISAKKVGLSLTISDKALKDFDRIQEDTIKTAENDQKFSWR